MNFISFLDETARAFCSIIAAQPGATAVSTKDYGWENHRWCSPQFRMAHVEIFNQDRFMVVHCCVFPHITDPSPIWGFDVISSESKTTGLFWDHSPTVSAVKGFYDTSDLIMRARPEWGDIFSDHFVACRPDQGQLINICLAAEHGLPGYLHKLGQHRGDAQLIAAAQDNYCVQQRRNEHTLRAIKNLIGDELAAEFMTTVLFPTHQG